MGCHEAIKMTCAHTEIHLGLPGRHHPILWDFTAKPLPLIHKFILAISNITFPTSAHLTAVIVCIVIIIINMKIVSRLTVFFTLTTTAALPALLPYFTSYLRDVSVLSQPCTYLRGDLLYQLLQSACKICSGLQFYKEYSHWIFCNRSA